jgi:putative hemolysin
MLMTPIPWFDVAIIFALIVLNGVFALSELAIVSARSAQLRPLADRGNVAAATALRLAAEPGKFLSTVQIGITLIGIVSGAYSGASLGAPVGERLAALGLPAQWALASGFALVIGLTTYATLIIGELVPKQIALRSAEPIALAMAVPMDWLARLTAPVVWLLDKSSALIFRLIGLSRDSDRAFTAEELQMIFAEATHSGVIEENERAMIAGVVRMADRPIREVMTPRTEVDWIDLNADAGELRRAIETTPHSRLVVAKGTVDDIVGAVRIRDIMAAFLQQQPVSVAALMQSMDRVPDQLDAMDALEKLRKAETPMLSVHDEYGHFEGIVTPSDLLISIVGEFRSDKDLGESPYVVERRDGSLLVSGAMPIDQLAERLGLTLDDDRDYATVAGHMLEIFRRLPKEGDVAVDQGWQFEVVDMDRRKIDKLLVRRIESDTIE